MTLLGLLRASAAATAATMSVDLKLVASARLKTYPAGTDVAAPVLWADSPVLFYVARRLG